MASLRLILPHGPVFRSSIENGYYRPSVAAPALPNSSPSTSRRAILATVPLLGVASAPGAARAIEPPAPFCGVDFPPPWAYSTPWDEVVIPVEVSARGPVPPPPPSVATPIPPRRPASTPAKVATAQGNAVAPTEAVASRVIDPALAPPLLPRHRAAGPQGVGAQGRECPEEGPV